MLTPGKYYPGTPHNCALYVPAQYDAAKPTPFMIFLDGSQAMGNGMRVPVVLDNLIAKHDLPPMIAIFIDPGILPASPIRIPEPLQPHLRIRLAHAALFRIPAQRAYSRSCQDLQPLERIPTTAA